MMTASVSRSGQRAAILLWRPISSTKVLAPGTLGSTDGHTPMGDLGVPQDGPALETGLKRAGAARISLLCLRPQVHESSLESGQIESRLRVKRPIELEIPNGCSYAFGDEKAAAEDGYDARR